MFDLFYGNIILSTNLLLYLKMILNTVEWSAVRITFVLCSSRVVVVGVESVTKKITLVSLYYSVYLAMGRARA